MGGIFEEGPRGGKTACCAAGWYVSTGWCVLFGTPAHPVECGSMVDDAMVDHAMVVQVDVAVVSLLLLMRLLLMVVLLLLLI